MVPKEKYGDYKEKDEDISRVSLKLIKTHATDKGLERHRAEVGYDGDVVQFRRLKDLCFQLEKPVQGVYFRGETITMKQATANGYKTGKTRK